MGRTGGGQIEQILWRNITFVLEQLFKLRLKQSSVMLLRNVFLEIQWTHSKRYNLWFSLEFFGDILHLSVKMNNLQACKIRF